MQAIVTKYKNGRIIASCYGGQRRIKYDHALSAEGNHEAAARALCASLGWSAPSTPMVGAGMPDGSSYVWLPNPGSVN